MEVMDWMGWRGSGVGVELGVELKMEVGLRVGGEVLIMGMFCETV
jgi:hypothetical protein